MDKLSNALRELQKSDLYPFHMPGHKRRSINKQLEEAYLQDITEIDGFDNLHHPEGIIKEEQEYAAQIFGAEESFFLVNGSSCGVIGAITTVVKGPDDRILMGRNAHKSAYSGLYLANIQADYLYPEKIPGISFAGPVTAESVEAALKKNDFYAGIFITSPTYEGVVSEIKAICQIAHQKGIPVIVDEAHGAHLGLWGGDGYFPADALAQGADIVIQSLHKTLPAMTQTAILHVQGELVDRQKLKMYLGMFQSSSPSYILMESISSCIHFCAENTKVLVEGYKKRLQDFYFEGSKLANIKIIDAGLINCLYKGRINIDIDPGKIIIGVGKSGYSGKQLYDILREKYHLQMEMAARNYVIAMTSVMDTDQGFARLLSALQEIDEQTASDSKSSAVTENVHFEPEVLYSIKEAVEMPGELIAFEKCEERISKEFVYLYPPGIPIIVPGEKISKEMIAYLKSAEQQGLAVQGPADYEQKSIWCVGN